MIIGLGDSFHASALKGNTLALREMDSEGAPFHDMNREISAFVGRLHFPVSGDLYKLLNTPLTKRLLRGCSGLKEATALHGKGEWDVDTDAADDDE